ncbi:hypothetical protein KUTeg_002626 [Tegillarca granosa]|uniref:Cysteine/serine-rich nuclear protein N-terminal domain-containing protein n=1 Tax=Tegillarca granosa TaxID=220873 RepID=A0ABQ9FUW1_TEGGR|nr:hypothetical protein KUTeg_002626 [Tegillarca granosa]
MGDKHSHKTTFTLADYAKEQKRIRKLILEEHRQLRRMQNMNTECNPSSDDDSDEEDSAFEDFEDFYYLQPISVRQRRALLRQSGVKKIDNTEKDQCKEIRLSREVCGCECRVFCDPESCACSLAGIKCQVDRLSFPCGCSKDGCGNKEGRVEFNPVRVRTHFIHTLMRLQLEKKEEESPLCSNNQAQTSDANKNNVGEEVNENICSEVDTIDDKDIDLTEFNSNELGSCRDCQNSDVCNAMMQEVQYATMEAEQQRLALNNMYNSQHNLQSPNTSSGNGPLPRVLLFNDSEEDIYNAENTTSYYNFKHDESSYSETSECSSEGSNTYENTDYTKTYQTLQTFDAAGEDANQEFCSRNPNSTQHFISVSTENGTQKYENLSSSNQLYKLEPISGMLSAVQNVTNNFDNSQTNSSNWRTLPHYSTMPLYTRSLLNNSTSYSNYTIMTNTTSEEIAANCPSMMGHMTHTAQSHMNVNKYDNIENYEHVQEKTYTDLDSSTTHEGQAKVYTDLDTKSTLEQEGRTYVNLNTKSGGHSHKCLVLDTNGTNSSSEVTIEPTNSFNSVLFSTSDTTNKMEHNLEASSTTLYENISEKFTTTSESCQNDITTKEVPCSNESCQSTTGQNFGEIIKESMVETVSA